MAKNGRFGWPTWIRTVGAIQNEGAEVQALCDRCAAYRPIDVERLIAEKGPAYSLINRRCRCTFTPGCKGWVKFHYKLGVYRPLWDDETSMRWMNTNK